MKNYSRTLNESIENSGYQSKKYDEILRYTIDVSDYHSKKTRSI